MLKRLLFLAASGFRTMIGGQALIEGIMMLGPEKKSIVVRKPDGELEVRTEPRQLLKDKYPFVGIPFIRGVVNFVSSMYNGVTALMWSAEFYPEDEKENEEPSQFEKWLEEKLGNEKVTNLVITLAMILGMGFSIVLFFLLPTAMGGLLMKLIPGAPVQIRNVLEGALRVGIFLGYLIAVSHMKDIHRTFQYHGAEHKTIFCYEAGLPLTVENVQKQPKHHPRCGTSFLFVVVIVSILLSSVVFSFIRVENTFVRMGLHLLMLPIVVGITYEINRYVGGHEGPICKIVRAPGMGIQRWTTFEPGESMMEVGIRALQEVLPRVKDSDKW